MKMTKYQCHKEVLAIPMTLGKYNEYRGWKIPSNEDANREGYLVEYLDGGEPNHPKHEGYISWSPKESFESGYSDVSTHTARAVLELTQLSDRIGKHYAFITDCPTFSTLSKDEQQHLQNQYTSMVNYAGTLSKRTSIPLPDHVKYLPVQKTPYEVVQGLLQSATPIYTRIGDTTKTTCDLQLPNGFIIGSGFSACVNPDDFNKELGEKYALERAKQDAENNLWQCEGYARAMHYIA